MCIILHYDGALFILRYLTGQQIVIKNHMLDARFSDKWLAEPQLDTALVIGDWLKGGSSS